MLAKLHINHSMLFQCITIVCCTLIGDGQDKLEFGNYIGTLDVTACNTTYLLKSNVMRIFEQSTVEICLPERSQRESQQTPDRVQGMYDELQIAIIAEHVVLVSS